jgi:hypothetical protein
MQACVNMTQIAGASLDLAARVDKPGGHGCHLVARLIGGGSWRE